MNLRGEPVLQIERVENISEREFRKQYSARNVPVIVAGAIDDWPAYGHWTLESIAENFGDERVVFRQPYAHKSAIKTNKEWSIREFIDTLKSGSEPRPYLNQVKLRSLSKTLQSDVRELPIAAQNRLARRLLPRSMRLEDGKRALFIGDKGSRFGMLHWDYSYLNVFISQIYGDKDFLVFSPADSKYVYPSPDYESSSLIPYINKYDPHEYPDLANATPIRFTLKEGETLFLPGGWWHATQMTETSISVAESSLDRGNWTKRYRWYAREYTSQGVSKLKIALFKSYMFVLGRALNVAERF